MQKPDPPDSKSARSVSIAVSGSLPRVVVQCSVVGLVHVPQNIKVTGAYTIGTLKLHDNNTQSLRRRKTRCNC